MASDDIKSEKIIYSLPPFRLSICHQEKVSIWRYFAINGSLTLATFISTKNWISAFVTFSGSCGGWSPKSVCQQRRVLPKASRGDAFLPLPVLVAPGLPWPGITPVSTSIFTLFLLFVSLDPSVSLEGHPSLDLEPTPNPGSPLGTLT